MTMKCWLFDPYCVPGKAKKLLLELKVTFILFLKLRLIEKEILPMKGIEE